MDYITREEFAEAQRAFLQEFPRSDSSVCIEILTSQIGIALAQRRIRWLESNPLEEQYTVGVPLAPSVMRATLIQALLQWPLLDDMLPITNQELLSEIG